MFLLSRILGTIVAALVATISLPHSSLNAEESSGRRIVIEIKGFEFVPEIPVAESGDTVVWINRDIVPHTVTATDGSWDSGPLESGAKWQMVVSDGLSSAYFCRFHPSMTAALMTGSNETARSSAQPSPVAPFN